VCLLFDFGVRFFGNTVFLIGLPVQASLLFCNKWSIGRATEQDGQALNWGFN
jgi:hypothetical protein